MKKVFLFLSVLLSLGMFYACSISDDVTDNVEGQNSRSNSDDNNSTTAYNGEEESRGELICPIEEGTNYVEISEFFQTCYYHYQGTEFRNFFEGSNESQCLIINNSDELLSKYTGVDPFPEIDFDKYTLIVGQEMMTESYYRVLRQELFFEGEELRLNVYVPELNGWFDAFQHLFYWGLYPKLQYSKISVKLIKERV